MDCLPQRVFFCLDNRTIFASYDYLLFTKIFCILHAGPRYYICEGCYYTGARYVPRTWTRERRSSRSFRIGRILHKRMHLGENVPRNAPRARNEDDRGGTDEMEDDARGGKEDRQMRLPGCRRRGSCTPLCTQPYRPSRVIRCDCTAYDCRTRYRLDRPSISDSTISACRKYRPV